MFDVAEIKCLYTHTPPYMGRLCTLLKCYLFIWRFRTNNVFQWKMIWPGHGNNGLYQHETMQNISCKFLEEQKLGHRSKFLKGSISMVINKHKFENYMLKSPNTVNLIWNCLICRFTCGNHTWKCGTRLCSFLNLFTHITTANCIQRATVRSKLIWWILNLSSSCKSSAINDG